ncbi:MAG: hypothetical protein ACOX0C_02820 [Patescibacteria group bacterium]|jgi:hypothetical protein
MAEKKKVKKILRVEREKTSGLSAFIERPVPNDQEVSSFERVIHKEARGQEIDDNLTEIYKDKQGSLIDVKKMKIKKRQIFLVRIFRKLLVVALLAIAAYFAYIYLSTDNDYEALKLEMIAPETVAVGEEFSYEIKYRNPNRTTLSQVYLELQYPDNFIISDFSLEPQNGDYGWNLPDIGPNGEGQLVIMGRLINKPESVNVATSRLSYSPADYSAQFKKEAITTTVLSDFGFKADLEYSRTSFIGQDNQIILWLSEVKNNNLGDLNLSFSLPEESDVSINLDQFKDQSEESFQLSKGTGNNWQISQLTEAVKRQAIIIDYQIKTQVNNSEIKVRLEKKLEDGQSYVFWEKSFQPELVKSDLNLTITLNDNKSDQAINFGETLNYSVSYNNQGEASFKDVVILVSLKGDFLDFGSLKLATAGEIKGKTIMWTKQELPELAEIKSGKEGKIDFSIKTLEFKDFDLGKSTEVSAYAQYGVNNKESLGESNKSNVIISPFNSDLTLSERILYFNDDNLPVGTGPLPPKVGELSTVRVYWSVKNNLHELSGTQVSLALPSYINLGDRLNTNVGSLSYNEDKHQVIWEIGRLPVSVYRADAEFDLSLRPSDSDVDKILVISPGAIIEANDTETNGLIRKKTAVKTTKLEDDDIAAMNNTGQIKP